MICVDLMNDFGLWDLQEPEEVKEEEDERITTGSNDSK